MEVKERFRMAVAGITSIASQITKKLQDAIMMMIAFIITLGEIM